MSTVFHDEGSQAPGNIRAARSHALWLPESSRHLFSPNELKKEKLLLVTNL
jgi:hypothetical protein